METIFFKEFSKAVFLYVKYRTHENYLNASKNGIKNPIFMAKCQCGWVGKESDLPLRGFSKTHTCPNCLQKWRKEKNKHGQKISVLTYFAISGEE